jgi:hypothetical protein
MYVASGHNLRIYFGFFFLSPLGRPIRSSITVDRLIKTCHEAATCQLLKASNLYGPISVCHVAISDAWTNQVMTPVIFLLRGMLSRLHKWYEPIGV